MPCPPMPRSQIFGRGASCESRCSAIHPEIPQCGIERLRPSSPQCRPRASVVAVVAPASRRLFALEVGVEAGVEFDLAVEFASLVSAQSNRAAASVSRALLKLHL